MSQRRPFWLSTLIKFRVCVLVMDSSLVETTASGSCTHAHRRRLNVLSASVRLFMLVHFVFRFITDSVSDKVLQSVVSIHPSTIRLFSLSFEPTNLWPCFVACVWVMTVRSSPAIENEDHRSMSELELKLRLAMMAARLVWPRSSIDGSLFSSLVWCF